MTEGRGRGLSEGRGRGLSVGRGTNHRHDRVLRARKGIDWGDTTGSLVKNLSISPTISLTSVPEPGSFQ